MIYLPSLYDWIWEEIVLEAACKDGGPMVQFVEFLRGLIPDTATATTDLFCPHCHRQVGTPNFIARGMYLWANQHGWCKRIFCSNCGAWHDVTERQDVITIRQVHPPYELDSKRRRIKP